MEIKVSKSKLIYGLAFLAILLNEIFEQYIPILGYLDEAMAIFALLYVLMHIAAIKFIPSVQYILLFVLITILIGGLGNYYWNYQSSTIAIWKDVLAYIKAPIIACALIVRKRISKKNDDVALNVAYTISTYFVTTTFIFGMISLVKNIGMSYDLRSGILSFKFLYTHPTFLASSLVLTSVVLVAYNKPTFIPKKIFYIENLITLVLTMRDKAFAYVALFIVLIFIIPDFRKIPKSVIPIAIIAAFAIAYFISRNKLQEYMTWSWSPREALYTGSFYVLKKCFPIGSGFATFANSLSGEYYSKLYYLLGMSLKPGVNPSDYADLGDAGMAYYIAQFGIIGLMLFIAILVIIFKVATSIYKNDVEKIKAVILIIGYIFISIFFEAVLTNESGAMVMVALFIYLGAETNKMSEARNAD
ncbi:hypothetical protein FYJ61_03640 [Lactobacillus equicursoris]|uniref:Polysaccharide polymerase n=1 Tax=Lactobacillus equicursoris TaxID=420645 RepID=A0A844FLZ3_9LACO|nr:hypothetical protein [Lactobacillus equicursoris]MST79590.1 hypothetical protein [Lactobacillus equicursoris]